ncbi:hypothetical protein DRQ26_02930 [bacterium]|nr:MAG: hypothetical protein DRQ26_02930 [bacterium]
MSESRQNDPSNTKSLELLKCYRGAKRIPLEEECFWGNWYYCKECNKVVTKEFEEYLKAQAKLDNGVL